MAEPGGGAERAAICDSKKFLTGLELARFSAHFLFRSVFSHLQEPIRNREFHNFCHKPWWNVSPAEDSGLVEYKGAVLRRCRPTKTSGHSYNRCKCM
jgi:hypothetical protein